MFANNFLKVKDYQRSSNSKPPGLAFTLEVKIMFGNKSFQIPLRNQLLISQQPY